jgi:hypothetical protein
MANAVIDKTLTITDAVQGVTEWQVERKINTGEYAIIDPYTCNHTFNASSEMEIYSFAYQDVISSDDFEIGDTVQYRFTPTGYDTGNGIAFESPVYTVVEGGIVSGMSMSLSMGIIL